MSGKVYFELRAARRELGISDVALVRVEQFYPFPSDLLTAELARYRKDVELVWCQEEPRNMGAWPQFDEWFRESVGRTPDYVGRAVAASPATGFPELHKAEQAGLIEAALHFKD